MKPRRTVRRHHLGGARVPVQAPRKGKAYAKDAPKFKKAQTRDAARLERLERSLYDKGDIETADDWRYHIAHPRHEVWITEDARGLIAAILLIDARTNLRLEGVAVAKRAQGQGWGSRLLDHAERRAKALGKTRLTLEVRPDNPRAREVYKRNGFTRIGTRKDFYEDGADAVRMAKVLGR